VLLDGFPRTLHQAEALSEVLGGDGRAVNQAVYLVVPQKELIRRLSGRWLCSQCQAPYHVISHPPKQEGRCDLCGGELYQRSDDTSETARHRLGVYFKQTTPVIDYYRGQGVLDEVNGDRDFEVVEQDLIQAVRKRKAL
jgi:adenylate kinase